MRRAARQDGFTLVEIMVSLVVFMVALLGLVAMQEASIEGANRGREQTAGVNIARFVLAGIQNEITAFNFENQVPVAGSGMQPLLEAAFASEGQWVNLPGTEAGAGRFDAYLEHSGRSFYTEDESVDSAPFCAIYQVSRFAVGGGEGAEGEEGEDTATVDGLYRVKVRVAWPRKAQYQGDLWKDCTAAARMNDDAEDVWKWEVVELRTVMSREFTSRWTFDE